MKNNQNPNRDTWLKILKKKQELTSDLGTTPDTPCSVITMSFGLITYDRSVDAIFAENIVQVLEAIRDKTTFDYIKDKHQYLKYLVVVNLPIIHNLLNWGGSIRGAWFDLGDRYGIDHKVVKLQLNDYISSDDQPDSYYPEVNSNEGMDELVYALRAFIQVH